MHIQESGEMYLETIYVLSKANPHVRSVDISEHMGYSKPSVSRAVHILEEKGYILINAEGFITLTEEGKSLAEKFSFFLSSSLNKCLEGYRSKP